MIRIYLFYLFIYLLAHQCSFEFKQIVLWILIQWKNNQNQKLVDYNMKMSVHINGTHQMLNISVDHTGRPYNGVTHYHATL